LKEKGGVVQARGKKNNASAGGGTALMDSETDRKLLAKKK